MSIFCYYKPLLNDKELQKDSIIDENKLRGNHDASNPLLVIERVQKAKIYEGREKI